MKSFGYYTVSEAAKRLGVHANTLRNWEKEKKLIPIRDRASGYRYYSKQQIVSHLKRGRKPKIEFLWGYKASKLVRIEELEMVERSLDVMVSSEVTTRELEVDRQLFPLLKDAVDRGVKVRFIRDLSDKDMKERAGRMKRMGVETRDRKLQGVTMSIRDERVVRIEVPSDNPEQRLNMMIRDPQVARSYSMLFEKLWGS